MSPNQGVYCCGWPTERIFLFAVDTIVNALDHCNIVCADLRKVFNSLNHAVIGMPQHNQYTIGILGPELWFTDHLSHCIQCIKVRYRTSSRSSVKGSVPQGSVLGPLLFVT